MKLNNISNFKETIDLLFTFIENNNIPCLLGSYAELKEATELIYKSEIITWNCAPSYPSLSIDFKLTYDFEFRKVFYFLFKDINDQRENSVLFDLSSFNDSISFIRFEMYSTKYLPFIIGLTEVPGSIEVYTSEGEVEELDEIETSEIMSLTEFESFLCEHPIPGKITFVEVE